MAQRVKTGCQAEFAPITHMVMERDSSTISSDVHKCVHTHTHYIIKIKINKIFKLVTKNLKENIYTNKGVS